MRRKYKILLAAAVAVIRRSELHPHGQSKNGITRNGGASHAYPSARLTPPKARLKTSCRKCVLSALWWGSHNITMALSLTT